MKKMISCLAVLALFAAVPAATVFAAETAAVTVAAETAYDETDIRNITGQWRYQLAAEGNTVDISAIDNGIITVMEDGTYTYTDLEGNTHSGTVKVDYDTFGGEYNVPFFAFYEGDQFFIGCYCQQNNPNAYMIGNGGMAQLLSVDADFSAITGEWEELNGNRRVFNISANGVYTVTYPDNSTDYGFIRIGNEMFSDNNDSKWYNFYNTNGIAWIGFPMTGSETVNELKAGEFTLRRMNADIGDPVNQEESEDERLADKSEIAAARMEDLNAVFAVMNADAQYTTEDSDVEGYVRVTDYRFSSISDVKNFISATCTGILKDNLLDECDYCFTEKEGSLYVRFDGCGFLNFETEYGVAVIDPAMNCFTAVTIGGNWFWGNGKAELKYSEGRWKISSYYFGPWSEIMAVENYDFSTVAGIWYENIETNEAVLNIRTDGLFSYTNNNTTYYGMLRPVYWLNEEGGKIIGLELVTNGDFASIAGFTAPSESPCNDIYLDQDGESIHFIRREEPGIYTVEQLSDMAVNDYEEKTGIRPANTRPMVNAGDSVTVVFSDENGNDFDAYNLDPDTGIGEKFSDGSKINLPQTGVNSLALAGTFAGASAITLLGIGAVIMSGKLRKKEGEE